MENDSKEKIPVGTKLRGPHPVTREQITVTVTQAWDNQRVLTLENGLDLGRDSVEVILLIFQPIH